MESITLHLGQAVPFPHAPDGIGQIGELRRRRIIVLYLRKGRICRRLVSVSTVAEWICRTPLLLPAENLLDRGIRRPVESRTYLIPRAVSSAEDRIAPQASVRPLRDSSPLLKKEVSRADSRPWRAG